MNLALNIDHIATVREARGELDPNPVAGALIAELAGVSGIVCHLREDRRHINDRDVRALRDSISTKLDLEMSATEEIINIALEILPDLVTIVPEKREELTTEGGLDVAGRLSFFTDLVSIMHEREIAVSFFVEPTSEQIEAVVSTHADIIELHTGTYSNARTKKDVSTELRRVKSAAQLAKQGGLVVTAGHGLNYLNIRPIAEILEIEEVSIGHSIISRAIFSGLERAVRDMIHLLR